MGVPRTKGPGRAFSCRKTAHPKIFVNHGEGICPLRKSLVQLFKAGGGVGAAPPHKRPHIKAPPHKRPASCQNFW